MEKLDFGLFDKLLLKDQLVLGALLDFQEDSEYDGYCRCWKFYLTPEVYDALAKQTDLSLGDILSSFQRLEFTSWIDIKDEWLMFNPKRFYHPNFDW